MNHSNLLVGSLLLAAATIIGAVWDHQASMRAIKLLRQTNTRNQEQIEDLKKQLDAPCSINQSSTGSSGSNVIGLDNLVILNGRRIKPR